MGLSQIHFHLYKITIQQQQNILLALQVLIVIKITFEHFLLNHFLKILLKIFVLIIIKHIIMILFLTEFLTTLAAVILSFSTLSGTNPPI